MAFILTNNWKWCDITNLTNKITGINKSKNSRVQYIQLTTVMNGTLQ